MSSEDSFSLDEYMKHEPKHEYKPRPRPKPKPKENYEPESLARQSLKVWLKASKTVKEFIKDVESLGGVVDPEDIKFMEQQQKGIRSIGEELDGLLDGLDEQMKKIEPK